MKPSPEGSMLALTLHNGTIEMWNTAAETLRSVLEVNRSRLLSVAFSPGGKLLALVVSMDTTAKIWDIASGTCWTNFTCLKGAPSSENTAGKTPSTAVARRTADKLPVNSHWIPPSAVATKLVPRLLLSPMPAKTTRSSLFRHPVCSSRRIGSHW